MTQRPQPCPGGGQAPTHTYTRPARGSGGVVRQVEVANCPADHDNHYDLAIVAGRVASHGQ